MSRDMTDSEVISNLNHIYGFLSPDIQRSLDVAFKALEEKPTGEWEIVDAEGRKIWNCVCTNCGHDPQEYIGGTENWWLTKLHLPNFCPNCGVRIVNVKGGKEE